jgi:hypothetical protein
LWNELNTSLVDLFCLVPKFHNQRNQRNQPEIIAIVEDLDADNCDQPDWKGAEHIDELPAELANAVDDICKCSEKCSKAQLQAAVLKAVLNNQISKQELRDLG